MFNVNGLVAVITAGGTGIGVMMANALATNGASKVYIVGRRQSKLDEAASSHPNLIEPLAGDLAETVKRKTGYINLLICNSDQLGPPSSGGDDMPKESSAATLSQISSFFLAQLMQDWNDTFALNCTAVFYTAMALLPLLGAGNDPRVSQTAMAGVRSQICVTSSLGGFNRHHLAGFAYTASKAAATHMVKVLTTFLNPHRVRVNAMAPGLFPTDLSAPLLVGKDATQEGAFPPSFIPAERTGDETDAAGMILYLASRGGAYANGCVLLVDGGRLGMLPATY
ncbi:hypothetical protein LTS18_007127 [Coniosporium uncinatum]|uniref:Uncharacterized protein n=1 Tax=Coniosporium uncinatum TaxID=93489 RepID=A0ACC3D373_9PEZI|nr:hypothetical protein LTS18_007127 [Coniosporium uncinatum]